MIANNILEKETSAQTHGSSCVVQLSQMVPCKIADNFNKWTQGD